MHGFGCIGLKFRALDQNHKSMIKYTPAAQLTLEEFKHPFEKQLDRENRWVKLASLIPWDDLASVYASKLDINRGRLSVDVRMVIGALIVKYRLSLSDRETVDTISENIYLQYFCGLPAFQTAKPFDPSLFVDIRVRLGAAEFDAFNTLVIQHAEGVLAKSKAGKKQTSKNKDNSDNNSAGNTVKNKGTLKVDATVADQQITFPTDLKIVNTAREETERLIDILHAKLKLKIKPRTYRREARKAYLLLAKLKRKDKKSIRKALGKQLRYINRNISTIERLVDLFEGKPFPLKHRDLRQYWIIQTVYEQQKTMFDDGRKSVANRIVSIWQPHVRPIVRGKEKSKVEFGSKINASEFDGWSRIDRLDWEAYSEGGDLMQQIENYKKLFGYYPASVLADQTYMTRENRRQMKELGISSPCKPLGRPSLEQKTPYQRRKTRKERAQRNLVEGKFGQGKNGYGLNEIKARRKDTSESWIGGLFFIMNLINFMKKAEKLFLCPIFRIISVVTALLRSMKELPAQIKAGININWQYLSDRNERDIILAA